MRNKLYVLFVVIGFLAVGTLAWAAPAGTGDRPAPPSLGFLFDKDAFAIPGSQAEPAGAKAYSKLSIKLYGGYNHMAAADVNDGSDFYFELVEIYQAEGNGSFTGGYKPLHGGFNFGADLIYQLTPTIGIGVGAGYMKSSADSLATYTDVDFSVDLIAETALSAVPIRLGLFLDVPLGGKLNLTANAGAAYYAGLKFEAMQGLEWPDDTWQHMSLGDTQRSGIDVGIHGSLGIEYKLSPMIGLIVEAAGRYAKLNNFERVTGTTEYSGGTPESTEGVLYIISEGIGESTISMFTVSETPPTDVTYREPKFDLSGFSLQAGIRIRL